MKFCTNCKTMMTPKRVDGATMGYLCRKCGSEEKLPIVSKAPASDANVSEAHVLERRIGIIETNASGEGVEHQCPSCGNDRAAVAEIKPDRFNDEQGEFLFKCLRCKEVDRLKVTGY